jgi:hypothetical protein
MNKLHHRITFCFAGSRTGDQIESLSSQHYLPNRITVFSSIATLVLCGLFSTGCVSSRYQMVDKERRQPPAEMGLVANADSLGVQLDTLIYHEGPGSWKSTADWDEYVFSVKNTSKVPVELTAITLVDPLDETIAPSADPWALESETRTLEKKYKEGGIQISKSVDPSFMMGAAAVGVGVGIELGAIAATEAIWAAALGGSTLAAGAVVALPVIAVASIPVIIVSNRNGKRAVEAEFGQRNLTLPYTIQPEESISGSVFFPIVPRPQTIQVRFKRADAPPTEMPSLLLVGEGKFEKLHVELGG